MNVLLINGSPHKDGCTNAALVEMAKTLNEAGIETTIFHIGSAPVGGCVGCGGCGKAGKCVFGGPVAEVLPLVEKADGIVFGAPVHYATAQPVCWALCTGWPSAAADTCATSPPLL